ncbi:hypothetical protein [Haloferax sp. DFSO60]|uniref:hypothetical protein n=1 Tax=Haloferax sp. DFSO60 TaxID=3388652 RepID=UPI003979E46F
MGSPRFTRRSLLRLGGCGLLSATAGCLAESGENDESQTTSNRALSMGEKATRPNDMFLRLSDPKVNKLISTLDVGATGHVYPAGYSNSQFLTLSVQSGGTPYSDIQLSPMIDGERYESQTYRHGFSPENPAPLSVEVPLAQAERAAIEWQPSADETYRWELPQSVVEQFHSEPRFSVTEFSVPDTVERGEPFTVRLSVSNTGDRDGRFLGVVLGTGPSSLPLVSTFSFPVPVGETVSRELSGRTNTEKSSMTAILDWGLGEKRASFSVSE